MAYTYSIQDQGFLIFLRLPSLNLASIFGQPVHMCFGFFWPETQNSLGKLGQIKELTPWSDLLE